MRWSNVRYSVLAVLAFLGGVYCALGYAMNASFSVASENQRNADVAIYWLWASTVLFGAAIGLVIAAWKHRPRA
jgi:hypothetical protein